MVFLVTSLLYRRDELGREGKGYIAVPACGGSLAERKGRQQFQQGLSIVPATPTRIVCNVILSLWCWAP
eukprot:253734-Pelagomonas_calceolata.AAC.1